MAGQNFPPRIFRSRLKQDPRSPAHAAARAAAGEAAAVRGGDAAAAMGVAGATRPAAGRVNGTFDRVPAERRAGGARYSPQRAQRLPTLSC